MKIPDSVVKPPLISINAAYIEEHKYDPCEKCGTSQNVKHIPTGSLARLTPLCKSCSDRMRWETDAYWRGYDDGEKRERSRPWWERLWK